MPAFTNWLKRPWVPVCFFSVFITFLYFPTLFYELTFFDDNVWLKDYLWYLKDIQIGP